MANHAHVVLFPEAPLARIMKAIKGYSGHQANKLLGRAGKSFWQHESHDHWERDRHELERIVRYTEANPVRAGLVEREEDWPWSSAAAPAGRLDKSGDMSHRKPALKPACPARWPA